jgi:hypothetical protein
MKLFICLISLMLVSCSDSFTTQQELPKELAGTWLRHDATPMEDECSEEKLVVKGNAVQIFSECPGEPLTVSNLQLVSVLELDGSRSDKYEYRIVTDGLQVVFESAAQGTADVYLQFWIGDDYGPAKLVGRFLHVP